MTTRIEWCDETWNPMTGCTPISEACDHCYAERIIGRGMHGYDFTPRFHADRLDKPLHWRKPRRVFVCSMSDLFHEAFTDEQIADVLTVTARAYQHTYMVLTKRPERARSFLKWLERDRFYTPGNLWLGVTAENHQAADERIPILLDTPAAVRFVSLEPMLGSVDLDEYTDYTQDNEEVIWRVAEREPVTPGDRKRMFPKLDLVILGGETGPGARPMQPEWALDVYRQCKAAGVPFFWKQWGAATERELCHGVFDDEAQEAQAAAMMATREFPEVQP